MKTMRNVRVREHIDLFMLNLEVMTDNFLGDGDDDGAAEPSDGDDRSNMLSSSLEEDSES